MKTRLLFRLLAVAAFIIPGVHALAQHQTLALRTMALDLLEKTATDASDREEIRANRKVAAKPTTLSAANFDLNKDGKLDDAEFVTWTAELRKAAVKTPDAMKRFDKNRDGQLSDDEWSAAVTELFGQR